MDFEKINDNNKNNTISKQTSSRIPYQRIFTMQWYTIWLFSDKDKDNARPIGAW